MMLGTRTLICLFALIGALEASKEDSCEGQCTSDYFPDNACQCNPGCEEHRNCCSDYESVCKTCSQDRCGQGLNTNYPCQCNQQCKNYNDCCMNYDEICNGGGGGKNLAKNYILTEGPVGSPNRCNHELLSRVTKIP